MMQCASILVYHHETCRNKKKLRRCEENRNQVLSFQTLTFDFTVLPYVVFSLNPLNAELNPICHLLALLGGATIVVVSSLRVNFKRMLPILLQGLG
jgi:hypothetical protein